MPPTARIGTLGCHLIAPDGFQVVMSVSQVHAACQRVRERLSNRIVGQEDVITEILVALLAGGHVLLVGVPGLAKTMLVRALSDALGLSFNRIQFTPDLMPADITGTEVLHEDKLSGERQLRFLPGPVFANLVLADEINRTPPKTQAALLEAMQEQQVTVGGLRHELPSPFFVLATQNPIEQEGTYPLPEAQADRFMLEIQINYPSEAEELEIARRPRGTNNASHEPVITGEELRELQSHIDEIPMAEHDVRYAMSLVRATRKEDTSSEYVRRYVRWGAGPRATQFLVLAAKAHAAIKESNVATWSDIRAVLKPVLRHRLILTFHAESDGIQPDDIIDTLLKEVPCPHEKDAAGIGQFFR
ncbi:MAG: MoxR family ATPase [Planctomycetaceae bacterium]|nr:MoxR family ATPase [Planctomycetaceae bacterium]MCB9952487.1 MoxR family ATPase [Planctomycetaceae bacterium]